LSILLVAVPVTLILTLVGLSNGFVEDSSRRSRGVGADIAIRPPDSSLMSFSINSMPEKIVQRLEQVPHVRIGMGTASQSVAGWTAVTGIDIPAFASMSGGFVFLEGHTFQKPDDILLDAYYAQQVHVHSGNRINILNRDWNVAGIVEPGKLSHIFLPLSVVQYLSSSPGKVGQIYLKLDDPKNVNQVMASLGALLPNYHIYRMDELLSLMSADKIPFLRPFLNVVIGIAVLIAFAVVSLSMYMAVVQRTREIGIIKSLGGSKYFVLEVILIEALILGLGGTLLGIVFSFATRWSLAKFVPASLPQAIVPGWWPIAGGIATGAAILGALYPAMLAARQDPIEALAYE
jgi:putative ABC transport system permease protein